MFKPIVCKAKTNITIPYSGTKKEKLELRFHIFQGI